MTLKFARRKKTCLIIALASALCMLALGLCACSGGDSRVAATVMGQNITEGQIADYVADLRKANDLTDDAEWANYLGENEMDAAQLRESVIYDLAQEIVVQELCKKDGITVNDQAVKDELAEIREMLGATDDKSWKEALSEYNLTEEQLTKNIKAENMESQLYDKELQPTEVTDDTLKVYVEDSMLETVAKHVRMLKFTSETAAEEAFDAISKASSKVAAFDEVANKADGSAVITEVIGWDVTDEAIDAIEYDLEEVEQGQITEVFVAEDGNYEILLVDSVYTFPNEGEPVNLGTLPADLKDALMKAAQEAAWEEQCAEWLSEQIEGNLEIKDMPEDLPYIVEPTVSDTALTGDEESEYIDDSNGEDEEESDDEGNSEEVPEDDSEDDAEQ